LFARLKFAVFDVSLGPLSEAVGDLEKTFHWVFFVVFGLKTIQNVGFVSTSFTVARWATMGELVLVVESAQFESTLETGSVTIELGSPVSSNLGVHVVVEPFVGE